MTDQRHIRFGSSAGAHLERLLDKGIAGGIAGHGAVRRRGQDRDDRENWCDGESVHKGLPCGVDRAVSDVELTMVSAS